MKDKSLNVEQMSAIVEFVSALKENHQVLDPVAWKARAIKINYVVAIIPSLWALGGAFGFDVGITSDQAVKILQFLAVLLPIWSNALLAATSKNVTMSPTTNEKTLVQRSLSRSLSNTDSDE